MSTSLDIARQWAAKARGDLLNADNNLASREIPYDTVCFHCQQAAEKLLKAYLVASGVHPPITHDLLFLLGKVAADGSNAETLRDGLALLQPYAVEIRYPDGGFMPSIEDAHEARAAAQSVLNWLLERMPQLSLASQ